MSKVYSGEAVGAVSALGWIWDGEEDYWLEGEAGRLSVTRSDEDEVRVSFELLGIDTELAGIYLDLNAASRLALMLGAAVVAS